ncbi:hypothetical protein KY330_04255 [Candidatus Woesearchaeota archaeon]|nr:hypothetical protein [Candidatus Woesearchaeota archaeon]
MPDSEERKELEVAFDYQGTIILELQNFAKGYLGSQIERMITSSETILQQRSELIAEIRRDDAFKPIRGKTMPNTSLSDFLNLFLEYGGYRKQEIEGERAQTIRFYAQQQKDEKRAKEQELRRELSKNGQIKDLEEEWSKQEKRIESNYKSLVNELIRPKDEEIATIDSRIRRIEREHLPNLKEEKELYILVAPVSREDYKAIRVVMPINASENIPEGSLIDYVYTTLNTELCINYRLKLFEDCSLEGVVHNKTSISGTEYYAIDIKFDIEDNEFMHYLNHVSEFISKVLNNRIKYLHDQNVEIKEEEIAQANIRFKPVVFPVNYEEFVDGYYHKHINGELEKTCDQFKDFIIDIVYSKLSDKLKVSVGEEILEILTNPTTTSMMFIDNVVYQNYLFSLVEKYKQPLTESMHQELLGTKYIHSDNLETKLAESPRWVSKEQAIERFFFGFQKPKKQYDAAKQANAFSVKIEGGKEYVNYAECLELHNKVVQYGNNIGWFGAPAILASEFNRKMGWDKSDPKNTRLNKILRSKEFKEKYSHLILGKLISVIVLSDSKDTEKVIKNLYRCKN